jgi:AAA domain
MTDFETNTTLRDTGFLPPAPLTTYEGWREFVGKESAVRPEVPTPGTWKLMTNAEKRKSASERRSYHNQMPIFETSVLKTTVDKAILIATGNYQSPAGVRPGFVLDGLGTVGKSSIFVHLGRKYERQIRKKWNLSLNDNNGLVAFIPVAYVTLPGSVTIRAFNHLFLRFYGIVLPKGSSEGELAARIVDVCQRCNTTLILIDDIHFLEVKNRPGQIVNNHLKYLASQISATFGYAGIDLEHSGILSEGASEATRARSQVDHRFAKFEIKPFEEKDKNFLDLLNAYEKSLCLVNQPEGSLVRNAAYIHKRTSGFNGAISQLLKMAANEAIRSGDERLLVKHMDTVILSNAAEKNYR